MAVINRFLKMPHRDWKEREEYGKSLIKHKNPYKEQSIMHMHTKRINVLEEYRALELLSLGTTGKHKWLNKDQDSESSVEQIDVKSNQFGTTLYGKTASEFFSSAKEIKYMLKTDQEQVGDRPLFHSELKRTNMSKVNWINYILAPFLILCSGL